MGMNAAAPTTTSATKTTTILNAKNKESSERKTNMTNNRIKKTNCSTSIGRCQNQNSIEMTNPTVTTSVDDKTDTVVNIIAPTTTSITTSTITTTAIPNMKNRESPERKTNKVGHNSSLIITDSCLSPSSVSAPNTSPLMVYHHVIAGWHDTHTEIGAARYYHEEKDKNNNKQNNNDDKINPVINPATNKPSLYYQETSDNALEHALQQATSIQQQYYNNDDSESLSTSTSTSTSASIIKKGGWWSDPNRSHQRAAILMKIADLLGRNTDRLADLEVCQIGRPRKEITSQLSRLPDLFVYYASLLRVETCGNDTTCPFGGDHINFIRTIPLGVVAQIIPFNHPLLITVKKLAPALAAGNCCILNPSEQAPASIIELAILCRDAGVPDGVITVVLGGRHVEEVLLRDPRICKVCQTTQKLGGKSPVIVFAPKGLSLQRKRQKCSSNGEKTSNNNHDNIHIDIDEYLDPIIGQTCMGGWLLVQRDIYSLVCEKMESKIKSFQMGDPFDMHTTFGPLINRKQMDLVNSTVTSCVGVGKSTLELLCGGKIYSGFTGNKSYLNEGNWYEPTLLAFSIENDDDDDDIAHISHDRRRNVTELHHNCTLFQSEEDLLPVLGILPFEDERHAIQLANDSPFSFGCSIWTNDLVQAHTVADRVRTGIIWVNDHQKNIPVSPWGGLTNESGVGCENGRQALMEYSQSKSVFIRTSTRIGLRTSNTKYN